MAVDVVQNNNSGRINYLDSIALGAIGGYALKWAIPVTSQEKDIRYNKALRKIEDETMKIIQKSSLNEVDAFVRECNSDLTFTAKKVGENVLDTFTKSIRPTKTFLEIGIGLALATAVIHNIFNEIAKDSKSLKPIN